MAANKDTYGTQITIPLRGDEDDAIRTEYTQMLRDQLAKGNNGLIKTKYLTFGICQDRKRSITQKYLSRQPSRKKWYRCSRNGRQRYTPAQWTPPTTIC